MPASTIVSSKRDVGALLDKDANHVELAQCGGHQQRRRTVIVTCIDEGGVIGLVNQDPERPHRQCVSDTTNIPIITLIYRRFTLAKKRNTTEENNDT